MTFKLVSKIMSTTKFPPTQLAILEALEKGISVRFCPSYGGRGLACWVRDDTREKVTAAVRALLAKSFVQRVNKDGRMGFGILTLKENGRSALASHVESSK